MNAPRQGLYAALLASSFALHAVLMIQGTAHQLDVTRAAQGELMSRQLAADALSGLVASDTVALALLTSRYGDRPDVAQLQILDAQKKVLASGGSAPTREGATFHQPVRIEDRTIGQIDLTLIEPSRGEIVRTQWLPLLLSLLLHVLLWLLYRVVARPARQESTLVPAPAPVSAPVAVAEPVVPVPPTTTPAAVLDAPVVMRIGFDDPRQLLDTLSPGLAKPYFVLCQTLLDQSILALGKVTADAPTCQMISIFDAEGARVGLSGAPERRLAEYAIELGSLFNVLAEFVYKRHREQKHFALHCAVAIAAKQDDKTARDLADQLLQHVKPNGVVVHVDEAVLTLLLRTCPLSALPHPIDAQMREAMVVDGLGAEQARRIADARNRILGGETKPATTTSADQAPSAD